MALGDSGRRGAGAAAVFNCLEQEKGWQPSPFRHPPPGWEVMDQRWGPATFPITMSAHFSDSQVTLCKRPMYLGQGAHWPPRLEATYGQAKADCNT